MINLEKIRRPAPAPYFHLFLIFQSFRLPPPMERIKLTPSSPRPLKRKGGVRTMNIRVRTVFKLEESNCKKRRCNANLDSVTWNEKMALKWHKNFD